MTKMKFLFLFLFSSTVLANTLPEFRYRIREDMGSLDWGKGELNTEVILQLMEGLTRIGPNNEVLPALASKWIFMEKSKKYIFEINPKARWSDGKQVCANDFIDAWVRALSRKVASPYAHYLFDIYNAQKFQSGAITDSSQLGLKSEGCTRLEVTLERANSYFPQITSHWVFFPIRKDIIEKFPANWTRPEHLVTTGAFKLKEWRLNNYYLMVPNPMYFEKTPKVTLKAISIPEDSTALLLFENKKLDWMKDLPVHRQKSLMQRQEYKVFPSYIYYHLAFRFNPKPESHLDSKSQRCALSMALDRSQIPKLLSGSEVPTLGILPHSLEGSIHYLGYNPEKAKKNFKPLDKPLKVYFYSKDTHIPLLEWVQSEWKKNLNLDVKLVKLESKTYWSFLQNNPPVIFLSGTTASFSHPFTFLKEFLPDSPGNWGRFNSSEFNEAVNKVAELSTPKQRKPWIEKAEKILVEDECAAIPLYFRQNTGLLSNHWTGFELNPLNMIYLRNLEYR